MLNNLFSLPFKWYSHQHYLLLTFYLAVIDHLPLNVQTYRLSVLIKTRIDIYC